MQGVIRFYDYGRGFGFITRGFHERYFFHVSGWISDIPPVTGMHVSFSLVPGQVTKEGKHKKDVATKVLPVPHAVTRGRS